MNNLEITVLCKVVDNFGDIGVAYRLCKNLKKKYPQHIVNLIVQGLSSFNKIKNGVKENVPFQELDELKIFDWDSFDFCYNYFSGSNSKHLQVILECFQCGRPEWLEKILFEDELSHIVNIIMIDYLTAEDYAETFHCLESLTRRAKVHKVNFMPGFTSKTGGLIFDKEDAVVDCIKQDSPFLFFCYDSNWQPLILALQRYSKMNPTVKVLVAQGKGHDSFIDSYRAVCGENANQKFNIQDLPFSNQEEWDKTMKECSFLFIRGEESLSRACLYGIPFVWHAYPQTEEYQLVKVKALLNKLKPYFSDYEYKIIEKVWIMINTQYEQVNAVELEQSIFEMLENKEKLADGFRKFSIDLLKNGDLVTNLMTFINKNIII